MKVKNIGIIFGSLLLAACECGKDNQCALDGAVDDGVNVSATGTAADFVATAGDRVFYDFDKSLLSEESKRVLDKQSEWLTKNPGTKLIIEGHCDERGTEEYNLGLGDRRANAAAAYLVDKGIAHDRLSVVSYGKSRPIEVSGVSEEERHAANRVSISVVAS